MAEMLQFWTVGVAGRMNNLNERYYSYEDAHDAAVKKAQKDPTNIYLVLKLDGYAEGEISINVNSEALEENIILPQNQYSIVGVTFTYDDGSFMDLTGCEIELLVLPSRTSLDSEAIYDVVVDGFSGMKEQSATVFAFNRLNLPTFCSKTVKFYLQFLFINPFGYRHQGSFVTQNKRTSTILWNTKISSIKNHALIIVIPYGL